MAIIVTFQLFARFSANVSMFISNFSHHVLKQNFTVVDNIYSNITMGKNHILRKSERSTEIPQRRENMFENVDHLDV